MRRGNLLPGINKRADRASSKKSVQWRQPDHFIVKLLTWPFLRLNFAMRSRLLLATMNYFNPGPGAINLGEKKARKYGQWYIVCLVPT